MAQRKAGELKKRCWLAKQRLKMGYFDSVNGASPQAVNAGVAACAADRPVAVRRTFVTSAEDERMYKQVCDILDDDEVSLNPIGQLIDPSVYDALDAEGKQRYILELSEKFRELRERYYKERAGA